MFKPLIAVSRPVRDRYQYSELGDNNHDQDGEDGEERCHSDVVCDQSARLVKLNLMNNRCKTKEKWNESVNDRSIDGAHKSLSSSCNVSARQTQNQGSALKNISHKDIGGKKVKYSTDQKIAQQIAQKQQVAMVCHSSLKQHNSKVYPF